MSTGALDNVSVPNDSTLVAPPPPDSPGHCTATFDVGVMLLLPTVLMMLPMQSWLVCVKPTQLDHMPIACTAVHKMCAACGCSRVALFPLSVHDIIYKPLLLLISNTSKEYAVGAAPVLRFWHDSNTLLVHLFATPLGILCL